MSKKKLMIVAPILVCLVLIILLLPANKEPVFRDVSWGMSRNQVKRAEDGKGVFFEGVYMVDWAYMNTPCIIYYTFTDDKLSEIMVDFDDEYCEWDDYEMYCKFLQRDFPNHVGEIEDNSSSSTLPMIRVNFSSSDTEASLIYTLGSEYVSKDIFIKYTPKS